MPEYKHDAPQLLVLYPAAETGFRGCGGEEGEWGEGGGLGKRGQGALPRELQETNAQGGQVRSNQVQ